MAKSSPNPFIAKLWEILSRPESWQYIKWNESGDGVEIVEPDGLMVNVLPKYFRQGKLCSFVRQLNLYGFEKQKDKWEFKHQEGLFRRATPEKLLFITRRAQSKKKREEFDDDEHLDSLAHHADKKREIIPSTPGDSFSFDASVVQHVPAESLQTYEERQSTQEAAIHYLMESIQQQKQEMNLLRNQVTMLSNYILTGAPVNPQQKALPQPQQPLRQLPFSQIPPQQNAVTQFQNQNSSPFASQQAQRVKDDPFARPRSYDLLQRQEMSTSSPSTDSRGSFGTPSAPQTPSGGLFPAPQNLSFSRNINNNNSGMYQTPGGHLETSINSEFSTVNLDEPQYSIFNELPMPQGDDGVIQVPSHWM